MNRDYNLVIFGSYHGATLHSVKFSDSELCEYEIFLDTPEIRNNKGFYPVEALVLEMIKEIGFIDEYLDYEVDGKDIPVCKIKTEVASNLRLFFLCDDPKLSIVGGGGVKPWHVRNYQKVPVCNSAVELLVHTHTEIQRRISSGDIRIVTNTYGSLQYDGNLRFRC
ncbi:MAG: hypothetical protein JSU77_03585 [Fidelibacterota bacterium]|nr:MAG: hypothetical protein JSU77_03585 [Candidatus Neomarinimicrobiota bacterium]